MSLQYLKKEVRDEVDFYMQINKVSYNVALSLLMGMIKHSQSTQNNRFAISLQYLSNMQSGYIDTGTLIVIEKGCTMKFMVTLRVKFRYPNSHLYANDI